MLENLNLGQAIEAAKEGKLISRKGWNGKGMFVFQQPADELPVDMVVDKVKSLPQRVKDYYLRDLLDENGTRREADGPDDVVKFTAYLCMKAADGSIVNGWLASQTDMLAEDWCILN